MEIALENLSKEELIKLLSSRDQALVEQNKQLESLANDSSIKDEKIDSLTSTNVDLIQERDYLKSQVEMYKRMQFGQKRERFEGDPNQIMLPFEAEPAEASQQQEEIKQKIEYIRKRPNHPGRAKLPEHLPVEEV